MLRFDKKQQNSIKQLFFNKQYKLKRKKREGEEGGRKKHNNLSKSIIMAQIFKVACKICLVEKFESAYK